MKLAGKVAVVTGASRGIGRAIATLFAREGARVGGCALKGPFDERGRGRGFLDDLPAAVAAKSFLQACDVRRAEDVARLRDATMAELGVPDVVVNNAGTVVRVSLADTSEETWDEVVASNLKSTFLVTRAFVPEMQRRKSGRFVNIASISGRQGTAMLTAYCAAKHGVVGLTRALAEELRGDGIQVNAICPGSVDTDMLAIGMPGGKPSMGAADIASVALYLAADAPAAETGSCLDVFG